MQIGFEVTAATPKRLRAAEDAPASETMRGERKITQAPSTDQKKVRRQMQRKTANFEDPEDIRRIASMPLNDFLASIGEDLTEIEVEAGIRDWWRARNTAFDPLKDSGLPGHEVSHAPLGTPAAGPSCNSCQGSGTGFHGETCNRCAGSGRANTRNPNFAIPADGPVRPQTAQPSKDILPANSYGRTAAMNDIGSCRMCEGPLVPKSQDGITTKAECADCGTKHELQNVGGQRSAAQKFAEFQNLDERAQNQIRSIAWWHEHGTECPECGTAHQIADGWADGRNGLHMMLRCTKCQHQHKAPAQAYNEDDHAFADRKKRLKPSDVGRTASSYTASLLNFVGSQWVVEIDTSKYVQPGMSAIARRAQSVLDTEESS